MKAKAWQVLVIAAGVVGAGAALYFAMSGPKTVKFAQEMTLVDIETGELFVADISKRGVVLPADNPDTARATLLPAEKGEDGGWYVPRRYLSGMGEVSPSGALDAQTGRVTVRNDKPRRLK